MYKHLIFAVIVVLLLFAGAFYSYIGQPDAPAVAYSWELRSLGEDDTGMPSTAVSLRADEKSYALGTYGGSCAKIEGSGWALQPGEKTGVICWWAGGGDELGVFEERGSVFVKHGDIEEGDAENPGFRGNYQTLIEL